MPRWAGLDAREVPHLALVREARELQDKVAHPSYRPHAQAGREQVSFSRLRTCRDLSPCCAPFG